jgi:hypothetical protein
MTPAEAQRSRRVSDAVVASYIHEIATRAEAAAVPPPRHDRLAHARRALRRREDRAHVRRGGLIRTG